MLNFNLPMRIALCVFCFLFYSNSSAQNLIFNPSFEEFENIGKVDWAKHWKRIKTPDLFHFAVSDTLRQPHPNSQRGRGTIMPRTGNGYVLKRTFDEVIVGTCKPLIKGHKYRVGAWLRMHPSKSYYWNVETSDFWIWAGAKLSHLPSNRFYDPPAQVVNAPNNFITDTVIWHKVEGEFIARGGEAEVAFGCQSRKLRYRPVVPLHSPWIYIDDVFLYDITAGAVIPEDKPIVVRKDKPLRLENIFFNTGKSTLLPASFPELDKLFAYLKTKQQQKLEIAGHTDNVGSKKFNQKLSAARAKAVRDYLVGKGIPAERLSFSGYGSQKPVAENTTAEGRQQNRRVEVQLISE